MAMETGIGQIVYGNAVIMIIAPLMTFISFKVKLPFVIC
jgi:hypothetical protein